MRSVGVSIWGNMENSGEIWGSPSVLPGSDSLKMLGWDSKSIVTLRAITKRARVAML